MLEYGGYAKMLPLLLSRNKHNIHLIGCFSRFKWSNIYDQLLKIFFHYDLGEGRAYQVSLPEEYNNSQPGAWLIERASENRENVWLRTRGTTHSFILYMYWALTMFHDSVAVN